MSMIGTPNAGGGPAAPGHPIILHFFPNGWDLMGGQWVAVPLADLTVVGKVIACLNCGSVVLPKLMDPHEKRCGGNR